LVTKITIYILIISKINSEKYYQVSDINLLYFQSELSILPIWNIRAFIFQTNFLKITGIHWCWYISNSACKLQICKLCSQSKST